MTKLRSGFSTKVLEYFHQFRRLWHLVIVQNADTTWANKVVYLNCRDLQNNQACSFKSLCAEVNMVEIAACTSAQLPFSSCSWQLAGNYMSWK